MLRQIPSSVWGLSCIPTLSLPANDLLVFAELCHAAGSRDNLSAGNYLPHLEENDLSFK